MSEKPEWFEMTEGDQMPEPIRTSASKRFIKVAAFTAPLLLVGGAMVFADGHEEDERPNIDTTISTSTTATQSSTNSAGEVNPEIKVANNSAKPVNAPAIAPKSPGLSAPSAKDDDDHEGFGEEREHNDGEEREHRERGEHHDRRGPAPTIPQSGTSTTKN